MFEVQKTFAFLSSRNGTIEKSIEDDKGERSWWRILCNNILMASVVDALNCICYFSLSITLIHVPQFCYNCRLAIFIDKQILLHHKSITEVHIMWELRGNAIFEFRSGPSDQNPNQCGSIWNAQDHFNIHPQADN